jgi:hypothetical protein
MGNAFKVKKAVKTMVNKVLDMPFSEVKRTFNKRTINDFAGIVVESGVLDRIKEKLDERKSN